MKKIVILIISNLMLFGSIKVDTTYSTLGAITKKVGGNLVNVTVLGSNKYDPHFIVPKPSLLSKLHRANLLIINGGGLEIGWLPPLLRNAHNPDINEGSLGFLDISHSINLIDKPMSVSHAFGDVHADGNPHYITDPYSVPIIAKAITARLIKIDSLNTIKYKNNLKIFLKEWHTFLMKLDKKMYQCKTKKIIQYHELFNYFLNRYNISRLGDIEPLPGIAPSSKHTLRLINMMKEDGVKTILQDVYHEKRTAKFIAAKTNAKIRIIPHDIGADGSKTLEMFYNDIADKICK